MYSTAVLVVHVETMVQTINTKAIWTLASVMKRPSLMVPQVSVGSVSEIDYAPLRRKGIRAVLFDKDNTLTAPYDDNIHERAEEGIKRAIDVFGIANVAIFSNSAGTRDDVGHEGAKRIERSLGLPVIRHDEKKPGGLKECLLHFGEQEPARLCMIGDRLLTDVVFGNLHGMLTIHTLPLCSGAQNSKDNWTAKVIRPVENYLLYGTSFVSRSLQRRRQPHVYWNSDE